jgi:hypothetical protein
MAKSELLGLYQQGARTKSARQFIQNVAHLRAALKEARDQGKPEGFIQQAKHDARAGILADLRETLAEERAEFKEKLEAEKAKYHREYLKAGADHYYARNRAQTLYAGLSDDELRAAAKEAPTDIDDFLALRFELRQRGGFDDELAILAEAVNRSNLAEPWKTTPVGEAVTKHLRLLEPVQGGGVLIDGGNGQPVGVDFDSLMDAIDESEAADVDQ